jgi:hypothetical protein
VAATRIQRCGMPNTPGPAKSPSTGAAATAVDEGAASEGASTSGGAARGAAGRRLRATAPPPDATPAACGGGSGACSGSGAPREPLAPRAPALENTPRAPPHATPPDSDRAHGGRSAPPALDATAGCEHAAEGADAARARAGGGKSVASPPPQCNALAIFCRELAAAPFARTGRRLAPAARACSRLHATPHAAARSGGGAKMALVAGGTTDRTAHVHQKSVPPRAAAARPAV